MITRRVRLVRSMLSVKLLALAVCAIATAARSQDVAPDVRSANDTAVAIVTSFYPMYIATLNVTKGAPGVEVTNLTPPHTGCLHHYHMTPDDLRQLSRAAIFVINGAGMEAFLDKAIAQLPALKVVNASEGIELLKGGHGDEHGDDPNPHVWLSVSKHIRQIDNIARQLAELDPARAETYRKNAAEYMSRLEALRSKMHEELKELPNRDIVTFHEAFPYFAEEFQLTIAAVIQRKPGSEPSARDMARTIEMVRKTGVKALFVEPQYSVKAAETIARETGARIFTLDPVVTGPMQPDAYLEIMEQNLAELRKALKP